MVCPSFMPTKYTDTHSITFSVANYSPQIMSCNEHKVSAIDFGRHNG